MTVRESVRARRRQRRRRNVIAVGVAGVVVAGGAGTAWAVNRSSAPHYRLATVTTGAVSQVVAADGALAAARVADPSFAVSGTVASVDVAVGDRVTAGQTLATMDKTSLDAAVASARTSVASANETLTDDEDGTSTSTSTGGTSTGGTATGGTTAGGTAAGGTATGSVGTATTKSAVTTVGATTTAVFTTARSSAPSPAGGSSALSAAHAKVGAAAKALAKALDGELDTVVTQCAAVPTTVTSTVVAAADPTGNISGSTGADTTAVSAGAQNATIDSDGAWQLTGLTPGTSYSVTITQQPKVVDAAACSTAVEDAGAGSSDVATALAAFDTAVTALQKTASTSTSTTSSGSGSTGSTGSTRAGKSTSGSSTSGNSSSGSSGSTSGSSASTTVTVTSEQLAADVAGVAAAKAALAVAKNQLASAALTSPVTGTVASVGITTGATVSAGSSSDTIEVVADGPLSVQLSIPLSKINLIKVGQVAHVTVDGRSAALPATVTYVGLLNSSSSSGSSSTYTVTVQLAKAAAGLFDGMGAQVSIDVGTADSTLIVPLSALHTAAARQTVDVYRGGASTPTSVTVGIIGANTVQIKAGLKARQQVVLADTTEAIPSSSTTSGTGNRQTFRGSTGRFSGGR